MPKSLKQVMDQIAKLEKQAQALRTKEAEGVIARIKEAIAYYGLTEMDLFGEQAKDPSRSKKSKTGVAKKMKRGPSPAKYRDESGNSWTGVGKRPNWFKAAIEAGKTPEELQIKS